MMNRRGISALASIIVVAVVFCRVDSAAAQGTVVTLADGVVVPGNGFVDLDPVDTNGFQQVTLLGFASTQGRQVQVVVGFATEPILFSDPGSKVSTNTGCGVYSMPPATPPYGVVCNPGLQSLAVGGPFLIVRLVSDDANPTTVTLKAYLK